MYSKGKSGLERASENEYLVLVYLHQFGWLRSKDIASLIWQAHDKKNSNSEPDFIKPTRTVSGLRMAQLTLKRLKDQKYILSANAPDGSVIYALAQKGVNRLNQMGVDSVSGKDLLRVYSFEQYRHRIISNEIAIAARLQGFRVISERQIAQNKWLFDEKGFHGKKPDCVIQRRNFIWWIEVERSRKNKKDYLALLEWLCQIHDGCKRPHEKPILGVGSSLHKIVFICSNVFEKRLISDLIKTGWDEETIYLRLRFVKSVYSFR